MSQKTIVYLTDEEIVSSLSGIERFQELVSYARNRLVTKKQFVELADAQQHFLSKIEETADKDKRIVYRLKPIRKCDVCGERAGYATYKRNSRYHRAGDINYDNPLHLSGVEFKDSFFVVQGSVDVGCCNTCVNALKEHIISLLSDREIEVPYQLIKNGAFRCRLNDDGNIVQIPYCVSVLNSSDKRETITDYRFFPTKVRLMEYTGYDVEELDENNWLRNTIVYWRKQEP